jgi:uncharacterized DUF497 family protein
VGRYKNYEWDDAKDSTNRKKHGLPLIAAAAVLDDPGCLVRPSPKLGLSEQRSIAIGPVRGRLATCVFVWRGQVCRII